MRCSDVAEWLDEGMPPAGQGPARAHAAACPACARAVAAATSLERALAAPPPPPQGGDRFVASVLQSIRDDRAARPVRDRAPERPLPRPTLPRILGSLVFEPAFAIGAIALVTVLLLPALPRRDAGQSLAVAATVVARSLEGSAEQVLGSLLVYPTAAAGFDPLARATLIVCFLALLVWAGLSIAGAVDRSLRGAGRRG